MSYSQRLVAERYRLTSVIGYGGMGRVWLARDGVLHRDVAVKEVVLPEHLTDQERDELCQRMVREARAAGRLSHPNVVAVYDVVHFEGRPWIVMELIRARSLYRVIQEDGPVTPRRAAEIGLAVVSALRTAHEAGVWHRDVKPGNVLLAEDGRTVLTDFGLATIEGDGSVTQSGVILGSAQYISPERARDGVFGPESDLWSLGATLYAAVEGRSPYARDTPMATLTALATQPPDPPRRAGPLKPVLIGLLRKNPRQRMRAAEVERLLTRIVDGEGRAQAHRRSGSTPAPVRTPVVAPVAPVTAAGGTGTVASPGTRGRRRWPWLVVAAAVVAAAVPAVLVWRDSGSGGTGVIGPTTSPTIGPTRTPSLTAAMGVQACRQQTPERETTVRAGTAQGTALANWTGYSDPAGFGLNVPVGWGQSRVGDLLCFRDPYSLKTIAVFPHGRVAGDPVQLVDDTTAWRTAAGLAEYRRIGVQDMHLPEGGAMLEYTYVAGGTLMHGQNWMMRLNGRLFTVFLLAPDPAWAVDRDFLLAAFASFHLVA